MMPALSCKGGAYEPGSNPKPETVDQRCWRPQKVWKTMEIFTVAFPAGP